VESHLYLLFSLASIFITVVLFHVPSESASYNALHRRVINFNILANHHRDPVKLLSNLKVVGNFLSETGEWTKVAISISSVFFPRI
jgi:hypothetical protein